MKVGNYLISWRYEKRKTWCIVRSSTKEGDIHPEIGSGYVKRLSTDAPDKEKARRLSLGKTLCSINQHCPDILPKSERKAVWAKYANLPKTPRFIVS